MKWTAYGKAKQALFVCFKMLQQHSHGNMIGHMKNPHTSFNTVVLEIFITPNSLQNSNLCRTLPRNHLNLQTPKAQVSVFKLKFENLKRGQQLKYYELNVKK
jgi:hypothetical protein